MSTINDILKAVRKAKNLTQAQFADKLDMKQSSYAMIEAGNNKPSLDLLKTI